MALVRSRRAPSFRLFVIAVLLTVTGPVLVAPFMRISSPSPAPLKPLFEIVNWSKRKLLNVALVKSTCTPSNWLFVTILGSTMFPSVAPTAVKWRPIIPLSEMMLFVLVTSAPPRTPSKLRRMPSSALLSTVLKPIVIGPVTLLSRTRLMPLPNKLFVTMLLDRSTAPRFVPSALTSMPSCRPMSIEAKPPTWRSGTPVTFSRAT